MYFEGSPAGALPVVHGAHDDAVYTLLSSTDGQRSRPFFPDTTTRQLKILSFFPLHCVYQPLAIGIGLRRVQRI